MLAGRKVWGIRKGNTDIRAQMLQGHGKGRMMIKGLHCQRDWYMSCVLRCVCVQCGVSEFVFEWPAAIQTSEAVFGCSSAVCHQFRQLQVHGLGWNARSTSMGRYCLAVRGLPVQWLAVMLGCCTAQRAGCAVVSHNIYCLAVVYSCCCCLERAHLILATA